MAKLITKFKYIKPGNGAGSYLKYIATREGVEKIDDSKKLLPTTAKQKILIAKLLRDFPDSREMLEYEDYRAEKTIGAASEFITRAIEDNAHSMMTSKTYADYIATRPRAERFGSHGLFTDDGVEVQLSEVSKELNAYRGNVYTAILSLKREDAARLGFDHGSRWRDFLRGQTPTLSENLKIPMNHLRWYAAYHNEGHHPHVHLIAYSTVPGEGHLSTKGVEKMRSAFAKEIFSQELMFTYQQQTEYRDRLREQGRERVSEIVAKINAGEYLNPRIEELLIQLSDRLSRTTGKKVYGYLKSDVKAIVDQIVAELAGDENIREMYDLWYEQREDVLRTYTDHFPDRVPLEQNREFKSIRNAVIQEALKINDLIRQAAQQGLSACQANILLYILHHSPEGTSLTSLHRKKPVGKLMPMRTVPQRVRLLTVLLTAETGGQIHTNRLADSYMGQRKKSRISGKRCLYWIRRHAGETAMPAMIWDGYTCLGLAVTRMRKKHRLGSGMRWKPSRKQNRRLKRKAICDTGSENAMPLVTGQNRTMRNLPGGFVRRWKIITHLLPIPWVDNTSGGRGWSRAVRKRIDCTPWRQSGAMHMHSTSLEGCTGMVSGQGLIWKNPSGGMPKHTRDFSLWRRLWQMISSAIALAP